MILPRVKFGYPVRCTLTFTIVLCSSVWYIYFYHALRCLFTDLCHRSWRPAYKRWIRVLARGPRLKNQPPSIRYPGGGHNRARCTSGKTNGVLLLWNTWQPRVNSNLSMSWESETGTSLQSQEKSTNWSRKANDIPWMLLAPHRQKFVFLTVQRAERWVETFTPALSQQSLPRLGRR